MKLKAALLVISSSVLLSIPWLVPHCGWIALFALVPLLFLEDSAHRKQIKHFFLLQYSAFLLWNAFTTFWVSNATIGGGIFAVTANALFSALIFQLFHISRRFLKRSAPYMLLVALWIAWEKLYFNVQISWPWLTLGYAFAQSTELVQWYEYLGSLGGSLWVLLSNIFIYKTLEAFLEKQAQRKKTLLFSSSALLIICPLICSVIIYRNYKEPEEGTVKVVIGQPNFDPYEKFTSMSQGEQDAVLLGLFRSAQVSGPALYIAPETFTGAYVIDDYRNNRTWKAFYDFLKNGHPDSYLLFGASAYKYFQGLKSPSVLARKIGNEIWAESYNSAIMLDSSARTQIFHKSKLVVGVELTPLPQVFCKIDDIFGGVMGRCVAQPEISLLDYGDVPVGCAICYESVYGDYCRGYVLKGAKLMTVITNDAWWGNTPGYRQHLSYSCLRAIELRREIARCGNTGISAIIDSRGNITKRSEWWKREVLTGEVRLSSRETFFVREGDMVGRVCSFTAVLLLLILAVTVIRKSPMSGAGK